jgi:hypothetical protein
MSTLDANTVAVDATPPRLRLLSGPGCGPANGSAWGSANATLCVSCGTAVEERYGCSLSYRVDGGAMVTVPLTTTNAFNVSVGPYASGSRPSVWLRVMDSVDNAAETNVTWLVDLDSPQTLWRVFPPPLTNATTPEFRFDSSKPNTHFEYSFDGGARVVLGGNSSSAAATATVATADTLVNTSCRRIVSSSTPTCVVVARYDSVSDATVTVRRSDAGNATLQVRLDGGSVWRDVRSLPAAVYNDSDGSLTLSSGVAGSHAIEVRAVGVDNTADVTPSVFAWVVDTAPPVLSYVVAPPRYADVPSDAAEFVLRCSDSGGGGGGEVAMAVYEWQLWRRVGNGVNTSWVAVTASWTRSSRASVSLSSLFSNTTYELRSVCVDAAEQRSDVVAHVWHSGECVGASQFDVDVRAVGSSVAVGERVLSWSSRATPPHGFEYRLDDGGRVRASDVHALVSVGVSAWHAFEVRPYIPRVCGGDASPAAGDTVSWFERESGHGSPGIVTSPALSSSSLFADFAFNCSGLDAWLQYSLDGSSWTGSDATLRVGPLSSGPHVMRARCVDSSDVNVSEPASHTWSVVSSSNSSLTLSGVGDGPHRLTVWAVDGVGNEERQPRTQEWTVDTVPPVNVAVLTSPAVTNRDVVVVSVSCGGEEFASLCVHCWQLQSSSLSPESSLVAGCSSNVSLALPSRPCGALGVSCADGAVSLLLTATDGAGNRNASAVAVSWVVDTLSPNTSAALNAATTWHVWQPALATYVVNSSSLQLSLSASEAVASFAVTVDGSVVSVSDDGVVSELLDGHHTLLVSAVDLAGNVDPTPVIVPIYVDTTPPLSTVVTVTSPSSLQQNATRVSLTLSCVGESPGLASHFVVTSAPSLPLPSSHALNASALELSTTESTTAAVSSGVYIINVSCVDVSGQRQRLPTSVVVTVDSEPPTCSLATLPSFTSVSNVTLHVSASDALSTPVLSTVVTADGVAVSASAAGSSVAVVTTGLSDGSHAWRVVCVDGAGNVASPSQLVSITVDTLPPLVWLPSPPLRYSSSATAVTVCRSDASAGTIVASLNSVASITPVGAGDVCVNVSLAADDLYVLNVGSSDAAGSSAVNVTVAFALDRTPPQCSYPTPLPLFLSNSSVSLPLSFSDALSPVSLSERVDGGASSEAQSSRVFEGLSEGVHTWSLLCVDAAGNAAPRWLTVNTTVDTIRPVVWLPSPPPRYSSNATVVTVCRSDASAGTIVASLNSVVSVTLVSAGDVCVNVSLAADDLYVLNVGSSDAAGNAAVNVTATVRVQRQRVAAAVVQRCVVAGVAERACRRRRVVRGAVESCVRGLE